jgi:hypothetical protein
MSHKPITFPSDVEQLLVSLDFLAQTKSGNKINIKKMSFVSNESWSGSLLRTFHGESRERTVSFITHLIKHAIEILDKYSRDKESLIFRDYILDKLAESKKGIANIRETYSDDPHFVSQLNICIDNIDLQFRDNK